MRRPIRPLASILTALILTAGTASFRAQEDPAAETPDAPIYEPVAARPSALADDLARETERAEAFREELARFEAGQALAEQEETAAARAALDRAATLAGEMQSDVSRGRAADRVYDLSVQELKVARPRLGAALDDLKAPPTVPQFTPALDLQILDAPAVAVQVDALRNLYSGIAQHRKKLIADQKAVRWSTVELRGDRVRRVDAVRIESLSHLSPARRARVLGLTREGVGQLIREAGHLTLSARLYWHTRLHTMHHVPYLLRDIFAVGSATWSLLLLAAILALALFLKRRGRDLLERIRPLLLPAGRGIRATRRIDATLGAARVLAPWTLFLLTLKAVRWAIGEAAAWPEIDLSYRLALLYGSYRLAIDVLFALIMRGARRYRLKLDAARTAHLIRSVRTLMRVLASIIGLLILSEQFLGRGYLYTLVVDFSWVVVLLALLHILESWRGTIVDAYLAVGPGGWLAGLVRSTREHWYGVFVAAASFGWLAGRAALVLARDFALGFDQTRRALAFMFRRRIEKHAERQGYSTGDVEQLPPALARAFTEEPVAGGALSIDHYPGLDLLPGILDEWRAGRLGGAMLLTGERGIGKTSWLNRVDAGDLPVTRVAIERRPPGAQALAAALGPALAPGVDTGAGLRGLAGALAGGPPRLVTIDLCQNLFLGTVGGYEAFESLIALIESTCRRVFWLCSFSTFAWQHLAAVRPERVVFRRRQDLPPWSEEEIRDLIRARTAASGVELTYEDLVVDRLEGVSADTRLLETEEGYIRLLWDYSDGTPRVALHFWLRSLVPESPTRARVRLFRAPAGDEFEGIGDAGLFLLAAIITHENLGLTEASRVTRYPEAIGRIAIDRLHETGVLRRDGDVYRVTTHWHRMVVRLLKRKNLISD